MIFLLGLGLSQAIIPQPTIAPYEYKVHNSFNVHSPSKTDLEWLAKVIYHEARGEDRAGKLAVAYVTIYRTLNAPQGKRTIKNTVLEKHQYSWNKKKRITDKESWENAKLLALTACYCYEISKFKENEVEFFYNKNSKHPKWTKKLNRVATIGSHVFYSAKHQRKKQKQ